MAKNLQGMDCGCGKIAKPAQLRLEGVTVPGWKCTCGEEYLDAPTVERLLAVRKLRLEKKKLTAKVTKQGNSFAIRVPMELVNAYSLKDKESLGIDFDKSNANKIIFDVPA